MEGYVITQFLYYASKRNPETTYVTGDMKTINLLDSKFDVVVIPDSIMYMTTFADLKRTIMNTARYLKTEGILLVVAHMKEDFKENNFAYSGEKENNHIVSNSTHWKELGSWIF